MNQPIPLQQEFWNEWNAAKGERHLSETSRDQQDFVLSWLKQIGRADLDIIEVGCGAGWLCSAITPFGRVTATDLSDKVLEDARARLPDVNFVAGDFMALDFDDASVDVVITLEVLSHVADQDAFVAKMARMLRPGGLLMMATQNRPVLERYNNVHPAQPGQLRRWVDRGELRQLLSRHLEVREIKSITLSANKGAWRFIGGRNAKRVMHSISGGALNRGLASAGLGWTLMALAQKPAA